MKNTSLTEVIEGLTSLEKLQQKSIFVKYFPECAVQ